MLSGDDKDAISNPALSLPCQGRELGIRGNVRLPEHDFRVRLRGPRAAAKIANLPGCRRPC